jgi:hypothetical protein
MLDKSRPFKRARRWHGSAAQTPKQFGSKYEVGPGFRPSCAAARSVPIARLNHLAWLRHKRTHRDPVPEQRLLHVHADLSRSLKSAFLSATHGYFLSTNLPSRSYLSNDMILELYADPLYTQRLTYGLRHRQPAEF